MPQQDSPTADGRALGGRTAADIAARLDRIPTGPFHLRLAATLGGGTFFDGFDAINIAVVLPLIVQAFNLDFRDAGAIIAAGYLGQWVGAMVVGALADRIGRRPAFVLSLAVFGALSIGCALSWSESSLLVFRVIQGLGLGGEVPIAGTLINEYLGRRNRGRVAVLYQTLFPWGLFFAPLVALATTSAFGPDTGWRVMMGVGALPLLLAVWAWFALPESARWLAEHGRIAEAEVHLHRMEREAMARGVVLEEPRPVPASRDTALHIGELFSPSYRGRTLSVAVVWFTTFFVTYGYTTWLPTMYVSVGGLRPSQSLVLTIVVGALQLVAAYLTAWLVSRVGRRPLFITAFVIAAVGAAYGAIAIGPLGQHSWPVLFSTGCILSFGTTVPSLALYLYTSELYPTRMRGWATSACSSLNRAASIISPFAFGFMLAGHGGPAAIFAALAVAAMVGLAAMAAGGVETHNRALEEISS